MKRITYTEISRAVAKRIVMQSDYETVADAQLQADKQAVGKCREKIADILRNYRMDISRNQADRAEIVADQVIKILEEE